MNAALPQLLHIPGWGLAEDFVEGVKGQGGCEGSDVSDERSAP